MQGVPRVESCMQHVPEQGGWDLVDWVEVRCPFGRVVEGRREVDVRCVAAVLGRG